MHGTVQFGAAPGPGKVRRGSFFKDDFCDKAIVDESHSPGSLDGDETSRSSSLQSFNRLETDIGVQISTSTRCVRSTGPWSCWEPIALFDGNRIPIDLSFGSFDHSLRPDSYRWDPALDSHMLERSKSQKPPSDGGMICLSRRCFLANHSYSVLYLTKPLPSFALIC
jgi:hypothetical protein